MSAQECEALGLVQCCVLCLYICQPGNMHNKDLVQLWLLDLHRRRTACKWLVLFNPDDHEARIIHS